MAIGSGSEGAQTALKEGYRADLTLEEAEVLALSTLKQVMEEKVRLALGPPAPAARLRLWLQPAEAQLAVPCRTSRN